MTEKTLDLAFLWHMHQPDYRDHTTGEHVLPWVYLHALKDYTDMANHLERHPAVRAVINFVPVLLDQIEDYCQQFATGTFRSPLLRLLATLDLGGITPAERTMLLEDCFRCNHRTMLAPFPAFQRLYDLQESLSRGGGGGLAYLSGDYFADLLTWYHLAWTGETERNREPLIKQLMNQGSNFSYADRLALLELMGKTLRNLIPRYRALAERGQIELSATPGTHPLAPLLLDFSTARDTITDSPLPRASGYPGGGERLQAHVAAAWTSHRQRFGQAPQGMWPAEGAVSTAAVRQMAGQGCRWLASGAGVLHNSLRNSSNAGIVGNLDAGANQRAAYRPWSLAQAPGARLFFRDEHLSDLIGFEYARWHGRDAARHFVAELEAILSGSPPDEKPVVSVILDGENAWEHYPYNGYFFFEDLYQLLENNHRLHPTTFAEILARPLADQPVAGQLQTLTAGSWVYGTLSTWIGDTEKNYAWDLLCQAKASYDQVFATGSLSEAAQQAAERQLAICESSDWFWWFGDYNPAAAVSSFDQLYRRNLANLYLCLGQPVPEQLALPISKGSQTAQDGTMRRVT